MLFMLCFSFFVGLFYRIFSNKIQLMEQKLFKSIFSPSFPIFSNFLFLFFLINLIICV